MPDSDLHVAITADGSGVATGVAQAKSAIDGFGPSIQSFAKGFEDLGEKIKGGFDGVSTALKGLQAAGAAGAEGLAGLAEAGGGVTAAIAAVAGIALSAAGAIAEWAAHTKDSSTASAEARQNAENLSNAMGAAGQAFGKVGDTLANALAPVMTAIVTDLTNLAKGFEDSYDKGGSAKTIVDLIVISVKALATIVDALVTGWIIAFDGIKGAIFSASAVWQSFADYVSDKARELKDQAITLGKVLYDTLTNNVVSAARDMQSGWAKMRADADATTKDMVRDAAQIRKAFMGGGGSEAGNASGGFLPGLSKFWAPGGAGGPTPPPTRSGGGIGSRGGLGSHGGGGGPGSPPAHGGGGEEACECDPSAAIACETQAQAGRNGQTSNGASERAAINANSNDQICAQNQLVTTGFVLQQNQQVTAATVADKAKVASNQASTRQITANNDHALKQFQSSMNGLVNSFAKGLAQMVEGSKSFSQMMRSMGQLILADLFRVVVGMVEKWAWGVTERVLATAQGQALLNALGMKELAAEIAQQQKQTNAVLLGVAVQTKAKEVGATAGSALSLTETLQTLENDAAKVFGGIFAALSQNPATLPIAAAAAGAGAALVLGFKHAEGGFDIPTGMNPLTQLHQEEMVLPARLANPMRDMLASYSSGGATAAGGHTFAFGDTHIHGAPNMSPADFKQALAEHRGNVAEAVAGALRSGWRPSYKQAVGAL